MPLPARPVVTAMMPPVPWRPYLINLLFCGHHSRRGEIAPFTAGATVHGDSDVAPPTAGGARAGTSGRAGQLIRLQACSRQGNHS